MARNRSSGNPGLLERIRAIPRLPARDAEAHKGDFGRVLVIGGSVGMAGAPALAGLAALRAGAGLVTIAVPAPVQPTVAGLCPCATTIALPATAQGQIDPAASVRLLRQRGILPSRAGHSAPTPPDVVAIGPGASIGPPTYARRFQDMIDRFRNEAAIPVVLDADALNMMAFDPSGRHHTEPRPSGSGSSRPPLPDSRGSAEQALALSHPAGRHGGRPLPGIRHGGRPLPGIRHGGRPLPTASPGLRTVITPHPGELARMHGLTTREIQADREGIAVRTATMMTGETATSPDERPVVVLKGAGTIVTDGLRIYVNRTGNPGMATGGSGDVLTGILAALIGQGLTRFDAAVLAVYLHGLAGDLAAQRLGQMSLIATDIVDALPAAILTLRPAAPRRRR